MKLGEERWGVGFVRRGNPCGCLKRNKASGAPICANADMKGCQHELDMEPVLVGGIESKRQRQFIKS